MKIKSSGMIILIAVGLLFASVSPALAMPPLPSSFYGTVKVNGVNVAAGTQVSAKINGIQYAYTTILTYQGDSVYSLDVPGDDPATTSVTEGGVAGNTVTFWIGATPANETAPWQTGKNVARNLTVLPPAAPAVLITAPGGFTVKLDWPDVNTNTQGNPTVVTAYRVFSNAQPYYAPAAGDQILETSASDYESSGPMGNLNPYFYIVRAVNLAGPSADSNRVGKFSYALVAGQAQ